MSIRKYFIKRDKHLINPEEILLDKKAEEMGDNQTARLQWPLASVFARNLFILCLVLIGIIFSRIFYLQIVRGAYYSDLADNNKTRHYIINAPRGIIYDRFQEPLVLNVPSFSLAVIPLDLPRDEAEREKIINQVVIIFNINKSEIENILQEKGRLMSITPILLKPNLEIEEIRKFEANVAAGKGFIVMADTSRHYLFKNTLAHVVGYIGKISSKDRQIYKSYPLVSMVGKDGLESYYESILQGKWGKRLVEVDALGEIKQDLGTIPAQQGEGLITTIDSGLQTALFNSLKKRLAELGVYAGTAIAVNPKTGEVLAMVSLPDFDPNVLTKGAPANLINQYLANKYHPLFNRAISGLYPTGSLIKPLVALAALEEKLIDPFRKIYDEGKIVITSPYNPDEKYIFHDWQPAGHGWVDMKKAIAVSCNVYFWAIGGGYKDIVGLGANKIKQYWNLFGLGKKQGIDLYGESEGVLPDQEWLAKTRPNDPLWKIGDTYNISIGEGGLNLTPLQMIDYISTIANNGVLMKPYLVNKIIGADGSVKKEINSAQILNLNVSSDNLKIIQEGMREVVISGTASSLNDLPITIAGKSGSPRSILSGKDQYHAIFGAYAPYNDPQIALLVLIERIPQGSVATLPVVRDVLLWYWENRLSPNANQ